MLQQAFKFLQREKGQGWLEYALVVILVAIVVVAVLTLMRDQINELLLTFSEYLSY